MDVAGRRGDPEPVESVRDALEFGPEELVRFRQTVRHWEILQMPSGEAVRHLPELFEGRGNHWDDVQAILRAHPEAIDYWFHLFEKPEKQRSYGERQMVLALAGTGDESVEHAVRAEAQKSSRAAHALKAWERARGKSPR